MRSNRSRAARQRGRCSFGRPVLKTCTRGHGAGGSCHRRRPTSIRSSSRACSSCLLRDDWLSVCREAVADVHGVLRELPTRDEREVVVGEGEGGDETTAVDAEAEKVILERLQAIEGATIVSEEVGELRGDGDLRIVVDPIDGSLNAKRGIPSFSLSIAIAEGETMDDVVFGFVHDFGSGEEWTAERGAGARLNGGDLGPTKPREEIEILSFEATLTSSVAEKAAAMVGLAYRLRIMGSLALSLCHLAAGRVDAVCSLKGARAVDIAAAQLLVRERGLAIDLPEAPPFGSAPLDVEGGSRVVAAATPEVAGELFARLSA